MTREMGDGKRGASFLLLLLSTRLTVKLPKSVCPQTEAAGSEMKRAEKILSRNRKYEEWQFDLVFIIPLF